MVFVKNPVLGMAKTRLANSVGDEKALEIYKFLLQYTSEISSEANCDRKVFYTSHEDYNDMFPNELFSKTVQKEGDLGQRMYGAFELAFKDGYKRVVIIGSDCYELSTAVINQAFSCLEEHNFTIGPAKDGGYYLLGMQQIEFAIFRNKKWSEARVYHDTVIDLEALNYTYAVLPILSDVDYLKDLPQAVRDRFGV